MEDIERLRRHHAERARTSGDRYHPTKADVAIGNAEMDIYTVDALRRAGLTDFPALKVLEVGSGNGGNLLRMVRWGFRPENLTGCELLEARHEQAKQVMPPRVRLVNADARTLGEEESFDVVFQSTVLSSILDDQVQAGVADTMWRAVRPGGVVISLDLVVNNPANGSSNLTGHGCPAW